MAAPAPVVAPIATVILPEPPPIPSDWLKRDVEAWAIDCGLSNVTVQDPAREDYPKYGFGYSIKVYGLVRGKERQATARYTAHGKRNFWNIDGIATG